MNKNHQLEIEIQIAIKNNLELITPFVKKGIEKELLTMITAIKDNLLIVKKIITKKIENKWKQPSDKAQASLERHDLYGNLTKVNFGIEFILLKYVKNYSTQEIEQMKKIISNDQKIYQNLRTIFA